MKDKKVIFMGTPDFSVKVLEKLIEYTDVVAVVTQPDKEIGRKKELTFSPVKEVALKNGIRVIQPVKIKNSIDEITSISCDIIVTCAYGQIIPEDILYFPKYNTVNVHASLLPFLRGGAPIQRAIMNGDKTTGITLMFTDCGMDSGNIIKEESIDILASDDIVSLSDKLSSLGAELLISELPSIFDGVCDSICQDHDKATFAPVIKREDEYICFCDKAINIFNKVRALSNIGAYCNLFDKKIKIFECVIGDSSSCDCGVISNIYKDGIGVSTLDNEIIIKKIQVEGKKIMFVKDYLNGVKKEELIGKKFN